MPMKIGASRGMQYKLRRPKLPIELPEVEFGFSL